MFSLVAVEDLVLPVGADEAADEGENEHHGEDRQTHDREAVAEKALGDQRARGKDLDAAVVVEGVILLGRLVFLGGRVVLSCVLVVEFVGTAAGIAFTVNRIENVFIGSIVKITHSSRPPFLRDAHAGVDHRVQDVGDQVAQQGQDR